jgi:hypothetical protein
MYTTSPECVLRKEQELRWASRAWDISLTDSHLMQVTKEGQIKQIACWFVTRAQFGH